MERERKRERETERRRSKYWISLKLILNDASVARLIITVDDVGRTLVERVFTSGRITAALPRFTMDAGRTISAGSTSPSSITRAKCSSFTSSSWKSVVFFFLSLSLSLSLSLCLFFYLFQLLFIFCYVIIFPPILLPVFDRIDHLRSNFIKLLPVLESASDEYLIIRARKFHFTVLLAIVALEKYFQVP